MKNIELQPDGLALKVYVFCLKCWAGFSHIRYETDPEYLKTNVCQFIRTLFVYFPLTVIGHVATVAILFYSLFYFPVVVFEWSYLIFWSIIGFIVLTVYLINRNQDLLGDKILKMVESKQAKYVGNGIEDVCKIMWQYIIGIKKQICPLITVSKVEKKGEENENI